MPVILNLHRFAGDINAKELILEENIKPVAACIFLNDTIEKIRDEYFSFSPEGPSGSIGVFLSKLKSGHIIEFNFKSTSDRDALGSARQFLDNWFKAPPYEFFTQILLTNSLMTPIESYFCSKLLDYSVSDDFNVYLKVSEYI